MQWFDRLSIRSKLTCLFVVMALLGALSTSMLIGAFDLLGVKNAMVHDVATLADVLARNSTAALTFRDSDAARDVLQALQADPTVIAACVYTADGKMFASYFRPGSRSACPKPKYASTGFEFGTLIEFRDIVLLNEKLGTIYLQSDLKKLEARLRSYAVGFLLSLCLTLTLSLGLATHLQQPISRPLSELVTTAQSVSHHGDYSIRAAISSGDEFGVLVCAFNGMLEQIQNRDTQLREHREKLENEVTARTAQLRATNQQLREAEEKYRSIFEDAVIGIFQITPDGRPIRVNRAMAEMHGFDSPEDYLAQVKLMSERFVEPCRLEELKSALGDQNIVKGTELEVYRRDQTRKWVRANVRKLCDEHGRVSLYEGTIEDISDRKNAEEKVQFLAYYDSLTGLANRTLLQDRLEKSLAAARRRKESVGLLFLDLDRFKLINDSLGHTFGDLLLQEVAERLKASARAQDTVARVGGDEFLMTVSTARDASDVAVVAQRVLDCLEPPFEIQGRSLVVTCSIGVSLFPDHGIDSETLVKNADAAMYAAKESGRNAFRFFNDHMNAEVVERLNIENNLRAALQRQELSLVYQPQADLRTGDIVGVEALLRWRHPEMGLVPPDKFIKVAENSGIIIPVGEWVLRTACADACRWNEFAQVPIPVAVNVSAVQFRHETFLPTIARILQETKLPPPCLELELTESLLLSNADVTSVVLDAFRNMGVKLAIDDFGTGYSSLSYLRQFPVQKLKIDRSFIRQVEASPDNAAITVAIISMAKSLNLRVIAEGVESEEDLAFLKIHGCDEMQGYYLSAPVTVDEIENMVKRDRVAAGSTAYAQIND